MRFIYTGAFRFPEGDAAASRVLNNARLLRDLGHDVVIMSFGGHPREADCTPDGNFYDGIRYINTNDIDTHSLKERILRYIAPAPNALRLIKGEITDIDCIISYNPTAPLNANLMKLCDVNGIVYIVDLTEWPASNETPGGKYFPIYWQSEYNLRKLQKRVKNFIPISTFLDRYYKGANSIVLPPLINIEDAKWNFYNELKNDRIEGFKGRRIVFAGTPAKKDLLGNLVAAICQILNEGEKIQLVVAGVSDLDAPHYFPDIKYFEKYRDNFVFLGKIPQNLVPSVYNISDFSAIIREPSRKNMAGFPTKMAESMASGCPVMLNSTSDLADYAIDNENAIILSDYSVNSILTGLRRIIAIDESHISSMKRMAKQTGQKKFDYRGYLKQMEKFVSNLR